MSQSKENENSKTTMPDVKEEKEDEDDDDATLPFNNNKIHKNSVPRVKIRTKEIERHSIWRNVMPAPTELLTQSLLNAHSLKNEKHELNELNTRLELLVDLLKQKMEENKALAEQIEAWKKSLSQSNKETRSQLGVDLTDARYQLNVLSNNNSLNKIRFARSTYELDQLKQKLNDELNVQQANKEKIRQLELEKDQRDQEINLIKESFQSKEAYVSQSVEKLWSLRRDYTRLNDDLDSAIEQRTDIESKIQTLIEQRDFELEIFKIMRDELKKLFLIDTNGKTMFDYENFYSNELTNIKDKIRDDFVKVNTFNLETIREEYEKRYTTYIETESSNQHQHDTTNASEQQQLKDEYQHNCVELNRLRDDENRLHRLFETLAFKQKDNRGQHEFDLNSRTNEICHLENQIQSIKNDSWNLLNFSKNLDVEVAIYSRLLNERFNKYLIEQQQPPSHTIPVFSFDKYKEAIFGDSDHIIVPIKSQDQEVKYDETILINRKPLIYDVGEKYVPKPKEKKDFSFDQTKIVDIELKEMHDFDENLEKRRKEEKQRRLEWERLQRIRLEEEQERLRVERVQKQKEYEAKLKLEHEKRLQIQREEQERDERERQDQEERVKEKQLRIKKEKEEERLRQLRIQEEEERRRQLRIQEEEERLRQLRIQEEEERRRQLRIQEEEERLRQLRIQEEEERRRQLRIQEEEREILRLIKIHEDEERVRLKIAKEEETRLRKAQEEEEQQRLRLLQIAKKQKEDEEAEERLRIIKEQEYAIRLRNQQIEEEKQLRLHLDEENQKNQTKAGKIVVIDQGTTVQPKADDQSLAKQKYSFEQRFQFELAEIERLRRLQAEEEANNVKERNKMIEIKQNDVTTTDQQIIIAYQAKENGEIKNRDQNGGKSIFFVDHATTDQRRRLDTTSYEDEFQRREQEDQMRKIKQIEKDEEIANHRILIEQELRKNEAMAANEEKQRQIEFERRMRYELEQIEIEKRRIIEIEQEKFEAERYEFQRRIEYEERKRREDEDTTRLKAIDLEEQERLRLLEIDRQRQIQRDREEYERRVAFEKQQLEFERHIIRQQDELDRLRQLKKRVVPIEREESCVEPVQLVKREIIELVRKPNEIITNTKQRTYEMTKEKRTNMIETQLVVDHQCDQSSKTASLQEFQQAQVIGGPGTGHNGTNHDASVASFGRHALKHKANRYVSGAIGILETAINGEYVLLENLSSTKSVNLNGWYLQRYVPDLSLSVTYRFPCDTWLNSGEKLKVWSRHSLPVNDDVTNAGSIVADNVDNWGVYSKYSVTKLLNPDGVDKAVLTQTLMRLANTSNSITTRHESESTNVQTSTSSSSNYPMQSIGIWHEPQSNAV